MIAGADVKVAATEPVVAMLADVSALPTEVAGGGVASALAAKGVAAAPQASAPASENVIRPRTTEYEPFRLRTFKKDLPMPGTGLAAVQRRGETRMETCVKTAWGCRVRRLKTRRANGSRKGSCLAPSAHERAVIGPPPCAKNRARVCACLTLGPMLSSPGTPLCSTLTYADPSSGEPHPMRHAPAPIPAACP
jgi:hypothetical protein